MGKTDTNSAKGAKETAKGADLANKGGYKSDLEAIKGNRSEDLPHIMSEIEAKKYYVGGYLSKTQIMEKYELKRTTFQRELRKLKKNNILDTKLRKVLSPVEIAIIVKHLGDFY